MNKPETVEQWLERLGDPAADRDYKPGHDRTRRLLANIELARPRLRIRIAGTNGKGSTAFMLARALSVCGIRVGLYTSPHIHCFNERIRINSDPIGHIELLSGLEYLMPSALRIGASYFEVATALALRFFSAGNVDAEILEAGVGARLDATTAVPADMALITPIGLDHQAWLGNSLSSIATEKAHVMDGCPWAISAPQARTVTHVLREFRPDMDILQHLSAFPALASPGRYQQTNASLAFAAMQRLKTVLFPETDMEIARKAIAGTVVPGRLQPLHRGKRLIWLDAAHNRHAIQALLPTLRELADPFDGIFIFPRRDRDLSDSLELLRPYAHRLITPVWMQPGSDFSYENLENALQTELDNRQRGRFLVLGSFTSVASAENWLIHHSAGH